MERDNPCYNPNRIGAISEAKVLLALTEAGYLVLAPCVAVGPYDFVIDDGERFSRVQVKTGRLFRGAVCFRPHRLRAAKKETGWKRRVKDYRGEVDLFGVYCPDNESVYLVPIDVVPGPAICTLRVRPAKNNQSKRVRWAKEYLVVPLQPPASVAEGHGGEPVPLGP
jgi:hypothetical protein